MFYELIIITRDSNYAYENIKEENGFLNNKYIFLFQICCVILYPLMNALWIRGVGKQRFIFYEDVTNNDRYIILIRAAT